MPLVLWPLCACAQQPPAGVDQLCDSYFREWIRLHPDDASQFGLTGTMGYPFNKAELTDYSEALVDSTYDLYARYALWLKGCDRKALTVAQQLDTDVLTWYLGLMQDGRRFKDHDYVLSHMYNAHTNTITLLTEYHTISGRQDALDYLARLRLVPRRIEQALSRLALQEQAGIRPPGFVLDKLDTALSGFAATPPDSNVLVTSFNARLAGRDGIDDAQRTALTTRARDIVRDQIYPAYRTFIQAVRASRAKSDSAAGVWKLPRGDAYYRWCLKYHTTTNLTPDQVHQLGLREVARLQSGIKELMKQLGLSGGPVFSSWMNAYWAYLYGPEHRANYTYPNAPASRQQVVDDYQKIIDQTWPRLPRLFAQIPATRVNAQAVPPYKEATSGTYYEPASLDGKRQGVFYANLGGHLPNKPGMATLAYHEAIPGHHFQIAVAQEHKQNKMYKNLLFFTGFGEGWAMYSERLAGEQGWFPDVPSRIANQASLLFRAVRLVLDTGIHAKRWTRAQAMRYMEDNLGWAHDGEVDRYIMWPGQACAYYVGMLKIVELREKAQKELGPRFDIREFHRVLLENGTLPLELAERQVKGYIAANK
jgi:uncharacterized protein (DUF885 family)